MVKNIVLLAIILLGFPYVSSETPTSPYKNDCGSATVLMILRYYGLGRDLTVKEIHDSITRGKDIPLGIMALKHKLDEYGIRTEIVQQVEDGLIIWGYDSYAHWVVIYKGYIFDPKHGIMSLENANVKSPYEGEGLLIRGIIFKNSIRREKILCFHYPN